MFLRRIRRRIRRIVIIAVIALVSKHAYASTSGLLAMANAMPHVATGVYYDGNFGLEAGFSMFGSHVTDIGIDVRTDFKDKVSAVMMGIGRLGWLSFGLGAGTRITGDDTDLDIALKGSARIMIFDMTVRGDLFFDDWGSRPEAAVSASLKLSLF